MSSQLEQTQKSEHVSRLSSSTHMRVGRLLPNFLSRGHTLVIIARLCKV